MPTIARVAPSLCHLFLVFFVAFCSSEPAHGSLPRLNRLTRETINPGASQQLATYAHDLRGNRSTRTASSAALPGTQSFDYDDNDRLRLPGTPSVQFGYDANGNTTTSPWHNDSTKANTDSYDAENRLTRRVVSVSTSQTMGYDHDGNRVWKHADTAGAHKTLYYLVDSLNPTGYPQVVWRRWIGRAIRARTMRRSLQGTSMGSGRSA